MTKRIVSLLIALIIPMALILSGCKNSKPLTKEEYVDALAADFKEYAAAAKELVAIDSKTFTNEAVKARRSKVKDACGKMEKALDKFADINPPAEFSQKHKTLLEAVGNERKFVKASEKLLTSTNVADVEAAKNELEAIDNLPTAQTLGSIVLALVKELKAAQ